MQRNLTAPQRAPAFDPARLAASGADTAIRALPAAPTLAMNAMGDSASPSALARLNQALADLTALRREAALPILHEALAAMHADRHMQGAELALKALALDETCGVGWHILAICREKADDFTTSLRCYETALQLCPDEPEIANDLGRLALRMGFKELAEQLFVAYLEKAPGSIAGANNLACAQRDLMRYGDAIETLKQAISASPEQALLWNTLATTLAERGDVADSIQFFDEALRLDPSFHKARYNRGGAKLSLGDPRGALADCEAALPGVVLESERAMMMLAKSTMMLAGGDTQNGWDVYEARFDPHYADVTHFMLDRPQWTPGADLAGKRLLVMGEQGLGDEVLFASIIPDLIEAVGPHGQVIMAVEPRLVPLLRRSFPTARVGEHGTLRIDHYTVRAPRFMDEAEVAEVDLWTPIASPLRQFRRSLADFPDRRAFLTPDPERVTHWKKTLAALGEGPKVGLIWKSLFIDSSRARFYSPFDQWTPVLTTPGAVMVNLQYGDAAAEIERARTVHGVEVWTPPGIDLKNDLDDLAALCVALDVVIGPATATINLAAACGANVWQLGVLGAWTTLGTDRQPWYPQMRVFTPKAQNAWGPVMEAIGEALAESVRKRDFAGT